CSASCGGSGWGHGAPAGRRRSARRSPPSVAPDILSVWRAGASRSTAMSPKPCSPGTTEHDGSGWREEPMTDRNRDPDWYEREYNPRLSVADAASVMDRWRE